MMMRGESANFAPHFAPSPAPVAQGIEQRFPKPQVAGPIPAEGASTNNYATDTLRVCHPVAPSGAMLVTVSVWV